MSDRKSKGHERKTEIVRTVLVHTVCPGCGVPFAIPQEMAEERSTSGGFLSCPNGHTMSLNVEATQKLIAQAQAEKTKQQLVVPRVGAPPSLRVVDGRGP